MMQTYWLQNRGEIARGNKEGRKAGKSNPHPVDEQYNNNNNTIFV